MGLNRFTFITAAIILFTFSSLASAGDVAKAKRNLLSARSSAESGRWADLDPNMKKAAAEMEGLSDAQKAPLLAEIDAIKTLVTKSVEEDVTKRLDRAAKAAEPKMGKLDTDRALMRLNSDEAVNYADPAVIKKLRERLATMTGDATAKTAPPPPTPAPSTGKPAPTGDLLAATVRVRQARGYLNQGDPNFAEQAVLQAMKLLETVPEADQAPVMADLAALNKDIEAAFLKAQRDEEFRRVDSQVSRWVGTAENAIQSGIVSSYEWHDKSDKLLQTNDVHTYLDAELIKKYQARVAAARVKMRAHNKAVALDRSADILKELEEKVAADPFKGLDEQEAYKVYSKLQSLSIRVETEFRHIPQDDADIKAVFDRLAAANAKAEAAGGKWGIEKMQEKFTARWEYTSNPFAGWEVEKLDTKEAAKGRVEGLSKTIQAIRGITYWLNERDVKETLAKHKDDKVVAATAATG
jgi:hypothetical protein